MRSPITRGLVIGGLALLICGMAPAVLLPADETQVWELRPYQIQVVLVPGWEGVWTGEQLQALCGSVTERAEAEIGSRWQLSVSVAEPALRRVALASHWDDSKLGAPAVSERLTAFRGRDKVVIVELLARPAGLDIIAREYDGASAVWSVGPRQRVRGGDLHRALFEAIDSVVAPQGIVKLASGHRVVLRQRASLLPVRNQRREKVEIGSVFQLVRIDDEKPVDATGKVLAEVDEINEQGIVCRIVARGGNPLEGTALGQWLALQSRAGHSLTRVTLRGVEGEQAFPLTGCEIWLSPQRAEAGNILGCPNELGEIPIPAAPSTRWLQIRVGRVMLRDYCLHPGAESDLTIDTGIGLTELRHAALLAACRDDLIALAALRDSYAARSAHRRSTGGVAEATELEVEFNRLLQKRRPQLLDTIRRRRDEANVTAADSARQFAPLWAQVLEGVTALSEFEQ